MAEYRNIPPIPQFLTLPREKQENNVGHCFELIKKVLIFLK